jgi:hypothetical protein
MPADDSSDGLVRAHLVFFFVCFLVLSMPADDASDGLVRAHIVFFCILFSIPPKKMLEVLFQVLYVLADDASNVLV